MQQSADKQIPKLDSRLQTAADFVRKDKVVADIGCDHGKLSVYLAANDCKKVIACDLSEKALSIAKKNLAMHADADAYECRLGDGLSVLKKDEADDIIIAGVSGITTADILTDGKHYWQSDKRFIFVPTSKHYELRKFLYENGFEIIEETAVKAAERVYAVMLCGYSGKCENPTPVFCHTGKIRKGKAAKIYIEKAEARVKKEIFSADETDKPFFEELAKQIAEVKQQCQL